MPLRDHFHPPLANRRSWDELHGAWPTVIVMALNKRLPPRYVAGPRIHLGTAFEIDVASYEEEATPLPAWEAAEQDEVATAVWSPPQPTLTVATDLPDQDEYEVRIYDTHHDRRLVAAVEIVSPSNKDRPDNRRLFVGKCAALLREQVSVAIIDVVTIRQFNLFGDLLEWAGRNGPSTASEPPSIYGAACRWRRVGEIARLETWAHTLAVGQPLPTLPLWLADNLAVPLELEASYEETCRILRIA
jgi:hypothetical protein